MLIDLFTVGAQIVNFLVLVYLLKRFLYGPIIRAMEKREETIAQRLQEAEQKHDEAEQEVLSYRKKIREIDARRDELLARAREEAEEEKRHLVRKARTETDEMRELWRETVREEQEAFLHDLRLRAGMQVCAVAGRILADLAESDLEQRMLEVFVKRSRDLGAETLQRIRASASAGKEEIVVTSSFELSPEMRRAISRDIHRQLEAETPVAFETSPSLICGIELRAGGYVVGWNLYDYLKTVEDEARSVLNQGMESSPDIWGEP